MRSRKRSHGAKPAGRPGCRFPALIAAFLASAVLAPAEHVTALGGIRFEGTIHQLDEKGFFHATSVVGAPVVIPAEDVVGIYFPNSPVPAETLLPAEFLFAGGDRIRATISDAWNAPADQAQIGKALEKAQEITLKSPFLGALKIKTDYLYGFVHHGKADELGMRDGFVERHQGTGKRDWVWLANGDMQQGIIEGFLKNDRGKIDMFYSSESKRCRVEVSGVVATRFQQVLSPEKLTPPGLTAVVTLVDGSMVSGEVLGVSRVAITLRPVGGNPVEVSKSAALSITFRNGRLVFLSPLMVEKLKTKDGEEIITRNLSPVERLDLTPESAAQVPYLSRPFVPQKDKSYGGNTITLGNRTFQRGIGTHSRSELTYALDGRFEWFESAIGIDSEVGPRGDAVFRVAVDGKDMLENGRMRGGDPLRSVRIPVRGGKELKLIVDYGEDLDIGDHADWAEACVIKAARSKDTADTKESNRGKE